MVHYFKKAFLASFFLILFNNSWSTVVLVQNTNDTGTGSLRDIITNANIGDTVMMNIKGTITLVSPINVPKTTIILGAFPVHSVIDCVNSGEAFSLTAGAGDMVTIQGFKFTNGFGSNPVINVVNGGTGRVMDCLFENNNGNANGQCMYVGSASALEVYNCSFINNSSSGSGGAIFIDGSTTAYVRNCTFYQNSATNQGGSIFNLGTNTSVTNNTFLNNTASQGGDIFNIGSVELINNIFSNPSASTSIQNSGTWITPSGNVFSGTGAGQYGGPSISGPNTIFVSGQLNVGIQTAPITDGYGLKYIRIAQQTSPCVDNGVTPAGGLLPTDCRRAPRILFGDSSLDPDAGALEFTPFTVTSNTTGPNDLPSKWSAMNGISVIGPRYMDFSMPGSGGFNPAGMLENFNLTAGEDWIVDGFTQPGSMIPGPGFSPIDVTPGVFQVAISQNTTTILYLSNAGTNSWISGLRFDNSGNSNHAIECDDASFKFFGNEIISSNASAPNPLKSGIYAFGIADCTVGGWRHHMRNVIGKQGRGLNCESNGMTVAGNFIGVTPDGMNVSENTVGVYCLGGNLRVKGKYRYPAMNVISGNISEQMLIDDLTFFEITGNIIGTDYSSANLLTTTAKGIRVLGNTGGYIGGVGPYDGNVIGGNIEGIHITAANAVDIHGNYIGMFPEGTMGAIPNVDGIYVFQNGNASHTIGDGTFAGRNYISGNSRFGIYLDATTGHTIDNNFIGLKPDNSALGNGNAGILSDNGSSGMQIRKNIIGSNNGDGIQFNNSGSSDLVQFNNIGTDSTGTMSRSNSGNGIWLSNTGGNTNISDNIISGNSFSGIELLNTPASINILYNKIGLDATMSSLIPNNQNGITMSNCNGHSIIGNFIGGNSANGMYISASSNISIDENYIGTNASYLNSIGNAINGIAFGGIVNNINIGGTVPEANVIAFNGSAGVDVGSSSATVGILNNVIFDNGGLGITLTGTTSPLANDINDADGAGSVGNAGQNYPDNLVAANCTSGPSLGGDIEIDQPGNYVLQVFRINPGTPDPSGNGEGNEFISEVTLNFLVAGYNTFSIPLPVIVNTGDILSVTSSYFNGAEYSTSEFSDTAIVRGGFTPTASITSNVSCFGGSDGVVTVSISGGVGPFSYQWMDQFNNPIAGQTASSATLPAGDYYCDVTDGSNTCVISSNLITISEPTALTLAATPTDATCFGMCDGSIVLNEAGGTPPYQFSIDNGGTYQGLNTFSGLCSGSYQFLVIDANGCTSSATGNTINIFEPAAISINSSFTNETCSGLNDGSITAIASGGSGTFIYQIDGGGYSASNTFSGLAPATYFVEAMDGNGCVFGTNLTINAGTSFIPNFSTGASGNQCQNSPEFNVADVSVCNGSSIVNWNWTLPTGTPSSATGVSSISNIAFSNAGVNNVTLVVTSADGCTASVTLPLTVNPQPIVDAGADATICQGTPFAQTANVFGGTPTYNMTWSPVGDFVDNTVLNADVVPAIYNSPGSYQHILNVSDFNSCTNADTMILIVNPLPVVDAGNPLAICQGSSVTLSGSGAISYLWDNSVIDGSPFTPVSTITYTVTGTDANGCVNTDFVTVTVDVPYNVNAGSDFAECESIFSTTFIASTNAPTSTWSTINGSGTFVDPSIVNATYNFGSSDSTQATISFVLTTPVFGTCPSQMDTVIVTLNDQPIAEAGTLPATACNNTSITLSGSAIHSSANLWTTGGTGSLSTPSANSCTYTPGVGESGFVTFFFTTSGNGLCSPHVDSVSINILDAAIANAGINTSICSGQTFTLDGSGSTGTITGYSWDIAAGPNVGTTVTANVSPAATTDYVLTVDNGSCNDDDTITISVLASPDASFGYSQSNYCLDAGNQLPSFITTAGGTFSMNPTPGNMNPSTGEIDFNLLTPGTYWVYYNLTVPCNAIDSVSVMIFGSPTVFAGNDTSVCAGSLINLNGTGSVGAGSWSSVNGFSSGVSSTTDTPTSNDTYTYSVIDGNGCTNSDDIIVSVNPLPTGTITGGGTFCEGVPNTGIFITNNSSNPWTLDIIHNGVPELLGLTPFGTTYNLININQVADNGTWTGVITDNVTGCSDTVANSVSFTISPEPTVSNNNLIGCTTDNPVDLNSLLTPTPTGGVWTGQGVSDPTFSPNTAGAGTWDLVYTIGTGCDDTVTVVISASPTVSITGVASNYCVTDPPFTPIGTPAGGQWSLDAGTFGPITTVDPSTFTQGLHTLSYQFTDTNGCTATTIPPSGFNIWNLPLDPTTAIATTQTICSGGTLSLVASNPNTGGGTSLAWYSDAALTNQLASGPTFNTPALFGSVQYYVVVQNSGCKSTPIIFDITVNAAGVDAGPDIYICPGTPAQLNVTTTSGTILWSPGISLSDSTIQNPVATPTVNTSYVVLVTNGPCVDADTVDVVIDGSNPDCGIMPSYNAFSPDGDGVNDVWVIDAATLHPDNRLTIFNRWGDKLVEFEDYDNVNVVWDGTYKGNLLPSGTYFYVLEYFDINIQVSGWMQITH